MKTLVKISGTNREEAYWWLRRKLGARRALFANGEWEMTFFDDDLASFVFYGDGKENLMIEFKLRFG